MKSISKKLNLSLKDTDLHSQGGSRIQKIKSLLKLRHTPHQDQQQLNFPLKHMGRSCLFRIKTRAFTDRTASIRVLHKPVDALLEYRNGEKIYWKAGEIIGQGSECQVIKALNLQTGQVFAIKRLYKYKPSEVGILETLSHRHIVRYLGSESVRGDFCIYLEYVPGGSVKSLIDKIGALPEDIAKVYIRQMLYGLEYLHSKGVVHCDLKSANLLVSEDGIKVCDFGFSRALDSLLESGALRTVRGSLAWTAPEVVLQQGYGRKADLWSVGCTVLEILTGDAPWQGIDSVGLLLKLATTDQTPPVPCWLSNQAKEFIGKCLKRNPEERPTIGQLIKHEFLD